ncbi:MAG: hypothetical protein K6F61_04035 [Clostridiales bacterium]|nr:hypothetical protein [Clostridiales bacterium]
MIGKLKDLMRMPSGEWVLSFTTKADPRLVFDKLKDTEVDVEIKKHYRHRSKTANDFMWAMCTDIGRALNPPIPKEEVYQRALWETRDAIGAFDTMHMRADAIPTFRIIWGQRGTGWFTEVIDYSDIPDCKVILAFRGSSTFDSRQMSVLIDYLKQDMVNMELPIPFSKEEEERMMLAWGKAYSKQNESALSQDQL